jgi:flagellar motor switch protein FliN
MPAQLEAPKTKSVVPPASSPAEIEQVAANSSGSAPESASGHAIASAHDAPSEYMHLADIPLQLEAVLGQLTMNMRAVASLLEGSVLTLNRSAGDNVDLFVAGVNLASGEIVVIEDALGLRITDLLTGE